MAIALEMFILIFFMVNPLTPLYHTLSVKKNIKTAH